MERGCQQNDSLADGYVNGLSGPAALGRTGFVGSVAMLGVGGRATVLPPARRHPTT